MPKQLHIPQGQPVDEWFLDEVQEYLSSLASPNFAVTILNPTTLRVAAGAGNDQVSIGIAKPDATAMAWRWNTANVDAAAPGSLVVGDNDVYVTAYATVLTTNPTPPPRTLDTTPSLGFGLMVLPPGTTPSGAGAQAYYRRVARATWDGTKFTAVKMLIGVGAGAPWVGTPDISYVAGRVGVGTATPVGNLHVAGDGTNPMVIIERESADASGVRLIGRKGRGTVAAPANVTNNDTILDVQASPYSNGFMPVSTVRVEVDAAVVAGQQPATRIVLYTAPANGAATERMRIDSAGLIRTLGRTMFNPATGTGIAFQSAVGTESARWQVDWDGKQSWGPGGAAAFDTNAYRYFGTIPYLATDNQFFANRGTTAQIRLGSNSGVPTIMFGNATGDSGDLMVYRGANAGYAFFNTDGGIQSVNQSYVGAGGLALRKGGVSAGFSVGTLVMQGYTDIGADASFGHNIYADAATGQSRAVATHGSFGGRVIAFSYGGGIAAQNGIYFYTAAGATTQDVAITMTERMRIADNGAIYIGSGADTYIQRAGISALRTNASLFVGGVQSASPDAGQLLLSMSVPPTTNPISGTHIYVDGGGTLKARGYLGTVTTLAPP